MSRKVDPEPLISELSTSTVNAMFKRLEDAFKADLPMEVRTALRISCADVVKEVLRIKIEVECQLRQEAEERVRELEAFRGMVAVAPDEVPDEKRWRIIHDAAEGLEE